MIETKYLPYLEKVLSPRRLNHSLGVMQVMGELAEVYGLDREKAMTIGILHDAAKDLCQDQIEQIILEGDIQIKHKCESDYVHYLHAPVGAYLVRNELGVTDALVLDAIRTHTFYGDSRHFDDPHSWCMRFSDILEPTRNWGGEKILLEGVRILREMVYDGKMAEAAFLQTSVIIEWYTSRGVPVHPNMFRVKKDLATHLKVDGALP